MGNEQHCLQGKRLVTVLKRGVSQNSRQLEEVKDEDTAWTLKMRPRLQLDKTELWCNTVIVGQWSMAPGARLPDPRDLTGLRRLGILRLEYTDYSVAENGVRTVRSLVADKKVIENGIRGTTYHHKFNAVGPSP